MSERILDFRSAGAAGDGSALDCFILLARFLGVPADKEQIVHDYGGSPGRYRLEDLVRIAKRIKLVARARRFSPPELIKLPLPAILERNDGGALILLKLQDERDGGQ